MTLRALVDPHGRRMSELFSPADLERLHATVDVVWARDDPMPLEDAREVLGDADVVVCSGWRFGPVEGHFPRLRAIVDVSGGFPAGPPGGLDYATCFRRGIHVLSAAPGFARQVAEMSLALALAACRQVATGDRAFREGRERYLHAGNEGTFMLYDQPVGFVGYGSIARELQRLLAPFGVAISAYDPWLGERYLRHSGVRPVPLPELMAGSRFVFVLAAPSSENAALLSRELLASCRPGTVVVLASRAHVVDFDALTELVLAGHLLAGVDVFPAEPLDPGHPIRYAEGAVLSAHRAGSVREGMWDLGAMVVDDLEMIAKGVPPRRLQPAARELVGRVT